ncbi:hypothetical protein [Thermomonospora umbrina]|uniref:Uncharacterized protein n=1 Tax=Thermomonospora umbrina TaxID=111806 RepID=A0A3D9SRB3_9ACTN|nr:hypothetical protein [Thermomonospora umbrina]REE97050.1 hypothetical protein DFJ69_2506 [Thermomonospora umbrina]
MRNDNNGKKAKAKQSDPTRRFGGRPDRRTTALSQGGRLNARRLPTRNMNRGR